MTTTADVPKTIARRAIEEVCARGDFEKAGQFYSPAFRDHEDWGYSDTAGLLRQLGPLRAAALGVEQLLARLRRR